MLAVWTPVLPNMEDVDGRNRLLLADETKASDDAVVAAWDPDDAKTDGITAAMARIEASIVGGDRDGLF